MIDFSAAMHVDPGAIPPPSMPPAIPDPLDLEQVKVDLEPYRERVVEMVAQAEAVEVRDETTVQQAVGMAGTLKKLNKSIEDLRKRATDQPREFISSVNNLCKSFQSELERGETCLKRKISDHQYRLEMERRERDRKAREEAERLQRQLDKEAKSKGVEAPTVQTPVAQEAPTVVRTEAGSAHQRKTWAFEVVNEAAVPREYCAVDERKIREAVKNGVREIPGCRVFEKSETVIRA